MILVLKFQVINNETVFFKTQSMQDFLILFIGIK